MRYKAIQRIGEDRILDIVVSFPWNVNKRENIWSKSWKMCRFSRWIRERTIQVKETAWAKEESHKLGDEGKYFFLPVCATTHSYLWCKNWEQTDRTLFKEQTIKLYTLRVLKTANKYYRVGIVSRKKFKYSNFPIFLIRSH